MLLVVLEKSIYAILLLNFINDYPNPGNYLYDSLTSSYIFCYILLYNIPYSSISIIANEHEINIIEATKIEQQHIPPATIPPSPILILRNI